VTICLRREEESHRPDEILQAVQRGGDGGDFYELSLGYFNEFYSRFIKRVFSLSFLRVLFSDLSKELSLFYLASFILYVISRVLVSDLASLLSSGSRTADRSS
jgi:hypothetical protein